MGDAPPRPGRALAVRGLLAALVIVLAAGGGVAAVGLDRLGSIGKTFQNESDPFASVETAKSEPGKPQTILLLGTDGRAGDGAGGARADTMLLARLDADAPAIALLSLPRDLKVTAPDGGADKLNAAFAAGGPDGAARAVKRVLGPRVEINHIVQVDFGGFRELVDTLGCAWIDVDRRYFNDVGGPGGYATIDVQPGYQRLCGHDALDYVRYRHGDNDLVRAARQQDFLRQLLHQDGVQRLGLNDGNRLAALAGRHTRTDDALDDTAEIVRLLKLGLAVKGKPVVQVPFGAGQIRDEPPYLTAPPSAVRATVRRFLQTAAPAPTAAGTGRTPWAGARGPRGPAAGAPPMVDARAAGEAQAVAQGRRLGFRFAFPARLPAGSAVVGEPRRYSLRVGDIVHRAFRTVYSTGTLGRYLGVQGTTWTSPPALDGPRERVTAGGRTLDVYADGRAVRLVAWRTRDAVYWVSNTLTRDVSRAQMLATARSLTRLR